MSDTFMTVGMATEKLLGAGYEVIGAEFQEQTGQTRLVYKAEFGSIQKRGSLAGRIDAINGLSFRASEVDVLVADADRCKRLEDSTINQALRQLQQECHDASYAAGWWHCAHTGLPLIPGDNGVDPESGEPIPWNSIHAPIRDMITNYWPFVVASKMLLCHAELSEGVEAHRRDLMDDKLTTRLGLECELADTVIREFDLAGAQQRHSRLNDLGVDFDLGGAVHDKRGFNKTRPDHMVANRRKPGGKKY